MKFANLLESVRSWNPAFFPKEGTSYTLRYVFYRKSDLEKNLNRPCFSVVSGLWIAHEEMFKNIQQDEDISSCIVEYVCEYDSALVGAAFLVREREHGENEQENNTVGFDRVDQVEIQEKEIK